MELGLLVVISQETKKTSTTHLLSKAQENEQCVFSCSVVVWLIYELLSWAFDLTRHFGQHFLWTRETDFQLTNSRSNLECSMVLDELLALLWLLEQVGVVDLPATLPFFDCAAFRSACQSWLLLELWMRIATDWSSWTALSWLWERCSKWPLPLISNWCWNLLRWLCLLCVCLIFINEWCKTRNQGNVDITTVLTWIPP